MNAAGAQAGWDAARAVQIVAVDGAGVSWFGSGYLVAPNLVLTAGHVLHGADGVAVRFVEGPGRVRQVPARAVFADARADVAVLRLEDSGPPVVPVVFGDLSGPVGCDAVGFPRFKLNDDHRAADAADAGGGPAARSGVYRDSHHAEGRCHPDANAYAGTLELTVPAPEYDPDPGCSPWEGMSGAAVFAGGLLVAVVSEHHRPQGLGRLTASRVSRWYDLLAPGRLGELVGLVGLPGRRENLRAAGPDGAGVGVVSMVRSLPRDAAEFTGRAGDLRRLTAVLSGPGSGGVLGIHAVDGMAGVGKTAFAVHAGHALAGQGRFPDGQWFVRLHGHTPGVAPADPAEVLAGLLAADGVPPDQIPADETGRSDLWVSRTAGRRMLLVLDDAAGSRQVRPLLPSAPGTLVLITSRRRLTGLPEAVPVGLDVLDVGEAAVLFAKVAGRPGLGPDDPLTARLAELCGYLPLAIGMAAARLRHHRSWSPQDLIDELTAAAGRLPVLAGEDLGVAAAFQLSYRDLDADLQRLFLAVGACPAVDVAAPAAAAMLEIDRTAAARLLDMLEEHRLVDEPTRGRYRMHDLLREHARTLADIEPHQSATVVKRLIAHYRHTAAAHRRADPEAGLAWQRAERDNLLAALDHADEQDLIALTADIEPLLAIDGPWPLALTLHTRAATTAEQLGDRRGQASALNDLGAVRRRTGDYAGTADAHGQALALSEQLGDRHGQANTLNELGRVRYMTGDYAVAADAHGQALALFEQLGDRHGQADALNGLGRVRRLTGDYAVAADAHEQALALFEQLGDRLGQADALNGLGRVRRLTGDYAVAAGAHGQVLALYEQLGDRLGQANTLNELGRVWYMTGDYAGAAGALERALALYEQLGNRLGQANALNDLGRVWHMTGDYARVAGALERALALFEQIGDRLGQAGALNGLGRVWHMTGDYAGAAGAHEQALALYEQIGDRLGQAGALNELGRVWRLTGDYPGAADAHERALALYEQLDSRLGQANTLDDLGRVRRLTGDYARAAGAHERALGLFEQLGDRLGQAGALDGLGECRRDEGLGHEAAGYLRQALEIYRALGVPDAEDVAARLAELGLENTDSLNQTPDTV